MSGRRLLVLLIVLAAISVPAGVLHAVCAGRSCDATSGEVARTPFCPLPDALKVAIANGFREGRSPDVLAVANRTPVAGSAGGIDLSSPWPALRPPLDARVPIVFAGSGVTPGASLPDGVSLDRIAPTVSDVIGFDRPFPDVRSGTSIDGVADGERPRLVLLIAWKGIGTAELRSAPSAWPYLSSLIRDGAGTLQGATGSLPLDPTATLATIGTGGLPRQHGVTGSVVRNDDGEVVPAFGDGAPVPVIASLADDLDDATGQRSVVSLVATSELDRGLIGGDWYAQHDTDHVEIARGEDAVAAVRSRLGAEGMRDDVPDVLGVVLDGAVDRLDRRTEQIVDAARTATKGSVLVVVAGTGSSESRPNAVPDAGLVRAVEDAVPGDDPAVAATVPGGMFLDQRVLTAAAVTGQVAVEALLGVTDADGRGMMADAFQGFAVSFARYC